MRDFNFFSPYIDIKRTRKNHRRYAVIAGALAIGIFAGLLTWSLLTVSSLQKEIAEREKFLNSPEVKKSLEEYEQLKGLIEKLNKYYDSAVIVDAAINRKDLLRTSVLDSIAAAMPKETFLRSISGNGSKIELTVTSSNKTAIAELERNLKQIQSIDSVHVLATNRIENYFTSSVNIKIKEVAVSEAD